MEKMFCPQCGKEIEPLAFCPHCGAKLPAIAEPAAEPETLPAEETTAPASEAPAQVEVPAPAQVDTPAPSPVEAPAPAPEAPADTNAALSAPLKKKPSKMLVICLVCGLLLIFLIAVIAAIAGSGSSSKSSYNSDYNYGYGSYETEGYSLSRDSIESLATTALYLELRSSTTPYGVELSKNYDLGSTRYSIGSIVEDGKGYKVRGTFTLYDYYGKMSSSYYNCTFTVNVSETGSTNCTINLK